MKVAHAAEIWRQLEGRVEVWTTSLAVYLDIHQTGPNTLQWTVRETARAPVEEWSLLFGDIIHNLRSALDALIYGICLLATPGPTAGEERRIYFPAEHDESKWETKWGKDLKFLEPEVLERVRSYQPFAQPDPNDNFLHHLHAIDIADKHRGQVYLGLNPAAILGESVQVAVSEEFPDNKMVEHKIFNVPYEASDGTIVAVTTIPVEIRDVRLLVVDRQSMSVWFNREGTPIEIGKYVPELIKSTKEALAFVRQGSPATAPGTIDIVDMNAST